MELPVYKHTGEKTDKKIALNESIFAIKPNDHCIYLDVKQYLANNRQGTHKSKEKGEIRGSTRKLRKQKGTGAARVGSIKSPIFRGGGRIFGPRPRDYGFKLNEKVKALARKSALSYMATDNKIMLLEDFKFTEIKTKKFEKILKDLKIENGKVLFVVEEHDSKLYLSSRNLSKSKVVEVNLLNTYDILHAENLVLSENSIKILEKKYL